MRLLKALSMPMPTGTAKEQVALLHDAVLELLAAHNLDVEHENAPVGHA